MCKVTYTVHITQAISVASTRIARVLPTASSRSLLFSPLLLTHSPIVPDVSLHIISNSSTSSSHSSTSRSGGGSGRITNITILCTGDALKEILKQVQYSCIPLSSARLAALPRFLLRLPARNLRSLLDAIFLHMRMCKIDLYREFH